MVRNVRNDKFEVLNELSQAYCGKQVYLISFDKTILSGLTGKSYKEIDDAVFEFSCYLAKEGAKIA